MSILTDFLDKYNPVQVVRLPLGAYLYKSDAVSGLASVVSDISATLSDYELREDLSTRVETNELSTGILSVNTAVFSVENVGGYEILSVNGNCFLNATDGNVVQAAVPRTELDAKVTVFNPEPDRYFRLMVLIDDRSMVNPDANVNLSLSVVEIPGDTINDTNSNICRGIYMRIPGSKEQYKALSIGVGILQDDTPTLLSSEVTNKPEIEFGKVADRMFFTGDLLSSNGEFLPTRVDLMAGVVNGEPEVHLETDSQYTQAVVEYEMRILIEEQQKQIRTLSGALSSIRNNLSNINTLVSSCTPEQQRTTTNNILTMLSAAVYR